MNKQKEPKLRFPGFTGEWVEKRLGDVCALSKKKINPLTEAINYKCLELEHLEQETGRIIGYTDSQLQKSIKNKFEPGDVLFGKLRPYLKKFYKPDFEGVCSSEIFVLQGKKVSNDYLYYLIQTDNFNQIANLSTGSKMPRSDWHSMAIVGFNIPTLPEQKRIAEFLSDIDTKIEKLTRKKELTEQYKKGAMQKIFSQKIRFKDENGKNYPDWVEKKLGDVAELTSSKRVYLTDYVNEGIPFYRGKEITELKKNVTPSEVLYISTEAYNRFKEQFGAPRKNDILITAVGTLGNIYRIRDDVEFYFKDGNLIWLKNIKIDSTFLEILLESSIAEITKSSIGSTQRALTIIALKKLNLLLPCLEEQKKIADFLVDLDTRIEHINNELAMLKEFKKGLLQGMFL